ncbi:DNA-binding transcriptional LysR family regulator [Paraburkholderia sp. GAS333]
MATDRLGDLQLFVEASTLGSLSAAGRKLGLSPAAASARLGKLEAVLRTRLFDRTTRQLRLTDEGRVYLQHCQIALQALADAEVALEIGRTSVQGKLRISASTDFGRNLLGDWLDEFTRTHPQVRIALTLTDSLSNLVQDDIDLAIRFGVPDTSSGLIARQLAPNWRVLCASPDYLARNGEPGTPDDLAGHESSCSSPTMGHSTSFISRAASSGGHIRSQWTAPGKPTMARLYVAGRWPGTGLRARRFGTLLPTCATDRSRFYCPTLFFPNRASMRFYIVRGTRCPECGC